MYVSQLLIFIFPSLFPEHLQTATSCRKAAKQFEKDTSLTGTQAMIDTDFCSDNLTCDEDDLDTELRDCQNQMGFGKGSEMRIGLWWRSINVSKIILLQCP